MRAQLLHLSGPLRGRTLTYEDPVVVVGSAADCTAVLDAPGVAAQHARIEWKPDECHFHLKRADGQTFVNGIEVDEVILEDDDQVELGVGGPVVRFRAYWPTGSVCKPVRKMLTDARDVARVSGGAAATQTLTRDLLTQATLHLKIGFPIAVIAGAFLAGWFGGWIGRPDPQVTRDELDAIRQQQARLQQDAESVRREDIEALRQQQQRHQDDLAKLARANAAVRLIQKDWSRGVCLVHGIYKLRMPDGSWFQPEAEDFEVEYTGSGFLATPAGHVVTNRHVLAPWRESSAVQRIIERGATPEFTHFSATFPGRPPVDVPPASIRTRDDDIDVAVMQLPAAAIEGVPVLPMRQGPIEAEDMSAFVVGYPTGLTALLARADSAVVDSIREGGVSMTQAIERLAAAGQVTPLITQGVVSNVQARMVVYDAETTHGGSGGPVFGSDGEVIAVNFAILPGFGGANFGVPIHFVRDLLPK
ncbi:MAG: trypsin-like peptidase domain-containing protein [Planctomycetota bacterium]